MNDIKVSIIVPVFNVENYLSTCIESLLEQTLRNIEILLVNDGSTDKSGSLCEKYAEERDNIFVLHKKNEGLGEARNYGVCHAKGEFIAFVDPDDKIAPNMLEKMYGACQYEKTKLSICNFSLWYPSVRKRIDVKDLDRCKIYNNRMDREYNPLALCERFHNLAWRKLYHRSLLVKPLFPKGIYHEDIGAWYATMALTDRVSIVLECLYIYRKDNSNSITNNISNEEIRKEHVLASFEYGYDRIKEFSSSDRTDELLTSLLNGYLLSPFSSKRKDWRRREMNFLKKLFPYRKRLSRDMRKVFWEELLPSLRKINVRSKRLLDPLNHTHVPNSRNVFTFFVNALLYILNILSLFKHMFKIIVQGLCLFSFMLLSRR